MKKLFLFLAVLQLLIGCTDTNHIIVKIAQNPQTFCNPLNLNYRFMKVGDGAGIREAADPVVVEYKNKYYLFASKSSGYWYSENLNDWTFVFISDTVMPIEDYAPGNFVHDDYIYYVGSTHGKGMLYRSNDPDAGKWEKVQEIWSFWDPAFYVEGDNLYMYHGCSPIDPILVQVLDLNTLEEKTDRIECLNSKMDIYGWERTGEHNELPRRPYIEGAWMTEHAGKYYLQYAGPGTEWKTYADGVYIGDTPIGPFTYAVNSPVSYKPTGFIGGAGHGCVFMVGDNYWKAATNAISVRHMFERRLSFFPSGFDKDGVMYTNTYLGDYPMFLPAKENPVKPRPDWMLLSYNKKVTVSSSLNGFPGENAVDEDARTSWVAATNKDTEWFQLDLGASSQIQAIQINFDEEGATHQGDVSGIYQSYILYASHDGEKWYSIVDNTSKRTDTPHDYIEFEEPFEARFIRLENKEYTVAPYFSLRGLRVFGKGKGEKPGNAANLLVHRNETDGCKVELSWNPADKAEGYIIRYGIAKDKLYNNFQVLGETKLDIASLNSGTTYYFAIDSYNENGITEGKETVECI